jgi:hypothetical protein
LRRVALLGGDIPQVKSLDDIPEPEPHHERFVPYTPVVLKFHQVKRRPAAGTYWVFSEVVPMDREEILKRLAQHGCDLEAIKGADDATLAEMLRVCEAKDDQAGGGEEEFDDGELLDDVVPNDGRTNMDDKEEPMPERAEGEKMMAYAERVKKWADMVMRNGATGYMDDVTGEGTLTQQQGNDSEGPPIPNAEGAAMPKKTTVTHQYSERTRQLAREAAEAKTRQMIRQEIRAALKGGADRSIAELQKFREETIAAEKKRAVEAFCEAQHTAGKLTPAEYKPVKAGGPDGSVYRRLLRADSRTGVTKFREKTGKVVEFTELDEQMREIESRPSKFSEHFKDPVRRAGANGKAADAKAERKEWAEGTFEKFSESFGTVGVSKTDFVDTTEKMSDAEYEETR